jgi:hypothetical protein
MKIMEFVTVTVQNKNGTTGKTQPDGSKTWLDFWKNKKNEQTIKDCKVIGCTGKADNGGHVIKSGESGKEYILPICDSCNGRSSDEKFQAYTFDLVPVHDD